MATNGDRSEDVRLAQVETRVNQIELSINSLIQQFRDFSSTITTKIEERNRPQWQVMIGIATFILAFVTSIGVLAYLPINQAIARNERDIMSVSQNAASVAAFDDFKSTYENNRLRADQDSIDKFARIDRLLETAAQRREIDLILSNINQRFTDMQRQVDGNTGVLNGIYSVKDIITNLIERINRVEQRSATGRIVR